VRAPPSSYPKIPFPTIYQNYLKERRIKVKKKKKKKKKKRKRKKEREKALKLAKNRTSDNCMPFGNIEKELARLALKSSQSRALK